MSFFSNYADLKLVQTLKGHTDAVLCLAWRPKSGEGDIPATLASCSADKTVRIWQQNSTGSFICKAVLVEPHTRAVCTCAWSPRGNLFATAFGNTIAIWECNNICKCNKGDFKLVSILQGDSKQVKSMSWTEASRTLLATCSRDASVRFWERVKEDEGTSESVRYECVHDFKYDIEEVEIVQWHPMKKALFSCCSGDKFMVLFQEDLHEKDEWRYLQKCNEDKNGHSSTVWALSFNLSGNRMVTSSDDLTLKVWGANLKSRLDGDGYKDWKHCCTLSGYNDQPIYSVHWSCDGIIASGAADKTVCLFVSEDREEPEDLEDSKDEEPRYKLLAKKKNAHYKAIKSVQWSSGDKDKRFLATASEDKTVKIWKLALNYDNDVDG